MEILNQPISPKSIDTLASIEDMKVSFFIGGIKEVIPKRAISFDEMDAISQSKEQQELTAKIIAETDPDKKAALKAKSPFITPYGTFFYRENKSIKSYNSTLIAFDFDKMTAEQVNLLMAIFKANKSCIRCQKSPRQKGVKALFLIADAITLENQYTTIKANAAALLEAIGASEYFKYLDNSQFKLCQPFYLAYDADRYYNPAPEPLKIKLIAPQITKHTSQTSREWDSSISESKKARIEAYLAAAVNNLCIDFEFETGERHPNIAKVKGIAGLIKMYNIPNEADIYEQLENSIVAMYGSEGEAKAGNAYKSLSDAWEASELLYNETIESILNEAEPIGNPFPIEALPQPFRELAKDLSDTVNFPIDYTATAMFTAAATAIGTYSKVEVKKGWIEQGSIFTCLIGNAGANKTHPVNTMFAVIKAIDKTRHQDFQFEYDLYLSYEKLAKKDKETIEGVIIPILEKSVLSNFTTEILFKRLSENQRGCTVVSDELISFFDGMNNYSKSDQIGLYLSIWSNQPTTIDRISNPVPLFLSNPYLSIIGGLQPRALNKAFPIDKLNNGFFQRFLFAYPDSSLKAPINDNVANEQLAKDYESFINNCYAITEPRTLTFSPAAKRYFYDWQANNCDRVNQHQNSIKGEVISKFDNHFIRLALLVQIMTDTESKEIAIEAVQASELLCEYYLKCAFKVLAKIQNTENYLLTLPMDKQGLFNELERQFTTAEAIAKGGEFGLMERAIKSFLNDTKLFKKVKHGSYQKNVIENQ